MSLSRNAKAKLRSALSNGPEADELMEALDGYTVYQLQEEDTGKKWINGKKIFRKVFAVPAQANNNQNHQPVGSTIEALISVGGYVNDGANILMLPVPIPNSNTGVVGVAIIASGVTLQVHAGSAGAHDGGFVILEYTKV